MEEKMVKVKYAVEKFTNGFERLKEAIQEAKDDLDKDGAIQRFEFTFELLWKALKIFLEYQGLVVNTPRESLKEAFRINLLGRDEEIFLNMLEDRNRTSHIYDEETSEEIFERIKTDYIQSIEKVLDNLRGKITEV
ncbi:nucleotidyltransferase [Candidatus Desantisbacteria bacterium CG2_30_40_21]|uniref:Nucleotidyltransferase n=5 Tax=unclassified Candidatus Desantisiibacteriota TaxID=3106372 RepID=A0A2M7J900_9BACT|nr:MAG: nucleotidyltransferase [Candidatus Desantisbacteria bacterium CG2_30_40_21]PIP40624.1 MAG: nucleotidyltransferase [Candidatus Desantisbacteria bacterium CG23_combo_of_CG06-09_8_20_14_all_40_23]PIX15898.1 MAG: nucleotidyltransferase [Candidatus Desantisbacteria bacterium CG_4_8_14_3_um_filter_40_12]PIY19441.1 MAG: nucleotidyltransferase [Candidatus Desantisbacteria bacterium CG_4_10_14_3_um_filter_40_18]PJB28276.1 MAG: nucleotidyltransferase [Candidatus Desantisbacteria bacterium CG_4_9_